MSRFRLALLALCCTSLTALAADPYVGYVYPAAIQAGTTNLIVVGGQFFGGKLEGWVSGGGVEVVSVESVPGFPFADTRQRKYLQDWLEAIEHGTNSVPPMPELKPTDIWRTNRWWMALNTLGPLERSIVARDLWVRRNALQAAPSLRQQLILTVVARPDAHPGMRQLRILRTDAMSAPHPFEVVSAPVLAEPLYAPPVRKNVRPMGVISNFPAVVVGQVMPGEVDRFRLKLAKGMRLSVVVEGRSYEPYIGDAVPGFFNSVIKLENEKGGEVAFADDSDRFNPDPRLVTEIPDDGLYRLAVSDQLFRGREDFVYSLKLALLADKPSECPRPPSVKSRVIHIDAPCRKVFEVFARRIGSAMDARMTLKDTAGNVLAVWDDVTNRVQVGTMIQTELDPIGEYAFTNPGDYVVEVEDTCGKSGNEVFHRLEVRDPKPQFRICARRSGLLLSNGQKVKLPVSIDRREGFAGSITIADTPFVRFENAVIPAGSNEWVVVAVGRQNVKMPPQPFDILAVGASGENVWGERVLPADEYDQAFAWRHLVPAGSFTYKCRYVAPRKPAKRPDPPAKTSASGDRSRSHPSPQLKLTAKKRIMSAKKVLCT